LIAAVVAIDFFLKSFIIISTHRQRHVASEIGFKQDSPNPNLDSNSLIECIIAESRFEFTMYPNLDSLIEYSLKVCAPIILLCNLDALKLCNKTQSDDMM